MAYSKPVAEIQRCVAKIMTVNRWNAHLNGRCPFMYRYEVNGKQLCARHAMAESLFLALKAGTAKRLAPPPVPYSGREVERSSET
jgi:hypothetical protein